MSPALQEAVDQVGVEIIHSMMSHAQPPGRGEVLVSGSSSMQACIHAWLAVWHEQMPDAVLCRPTIRQL